MEGKNLNIVSLDVPFPADYGGAIDIFYKIKALKELGVNIHLHCFKYGRNEQEELLKYCSEVIYYNRQTGLRSNISSLPYIINSRRNEQLLNNLKSNSYPILFEGLHTIYYLLNAEFKDRTVILRSHNIEHDYYYDLAKQEKNLIKKAYFYKEGFLLKNVLNKISSNTKIATISPSDTAFLKSQFDNTFWLSPFHSNEKITSKIGKGDYALYHGNLSVPENITATIFLIHQFANKEEQLIIAGKNPSAKIIALTKGSKNIKLISNPENLQMDELIKNAHVLLLPTFQATGIKHKLIESLYKGRFCIVNHKMIDNTMLENLCVITESDFYNATKKLMQTPFSEKEIVRRKKLLDKYYNNVNNAKLILTAL